MKRGFTLIELLVVVSVIGVLSAIVLASVSDARYEAELARGLVFEKNVHSALYDTLVAEYNFDGSAEDSYGSNDGTEEGGVFIR